MNFIKIFFNGLKELLKDDTDLRSEEDMLSSPFTIDGFLSKLPTIFNWVVCLMIFIGCLFLLLIVINIISLLFE